MRRWLLVLPLVACGADPGPPPPVLPFDSMEPQVERLLRRAHQAALNEPDSASAWAQLGFALEAHELRSPAEECLARSIELDPGVFEPVYMHAFIGMLLGRPPEVLSERFQAAIDLRPDYAAAHLRMGDALGQAGRNAEARTAFEAALAADPGLERARAALGQLLLAEGDAAGALPLLERAARLGPGEAGVQSSLAQAYMMLGREDEAQQATARARAPEGARLNISDPVRAGVLALAVSSWASFQRASKAIGKGDFEAAHQSLAIVLEAQPEAYNVRVQQAQMALALGRPAEAEAHLLRVLREQPGHAIATVLLAQIDVEFGRFDAGIARFESVFDGRPMDATCHLAWGAALANRERFAEAAAQYGYVAAQQPDNALCRYQQGLAFEQAGLVNEALAAYRAAYALQPDHPLAARLRALER